MNTARAWTSGWFRARIAADAARTLEDVSMPALTRDELSHVTRIIYEEARRLWRTSPAATG